MRKFASTAASAVAMSLVVSVGPVHAGNFSGFYAGAQLGDTFGDASSSQNQAPGNALSTSQADYKYSGLSGGVHIGYNHPIDQFVIGAIFDVNLTDASDSDDQTSADTAGNDLDRDDNSLIFDTVLSLRAKGGWLAWPGTLVYATAGWSWAYADATIEQTAANIRTIESQNISFSGFTYGLGTSFMIGDSTTLGFEWRHTNAGSEQVEFEQANNSYELGFDPDIDTVEINVSYYFSGPLN